MKANNNESEHEDIFQVPRFEGTVEPLSKLYTFRVVEEFEHLDQFEYIVDAFREASEDDVIIIDLASPGGSLEAIIPLLNAIKNRHCLFVVNIISDIASAATFLPMLADQVNLNDYVTIMLHNVSYGMQGSAASNNSYVMHTTSLTKEIISEFYKGFLTEVELKEILSDGTRYMNKQEFIGRFYNRLVALGMQEPIHEKGLNSNIKDFI
jgi:ATP-dependent protease ClpP protease subunit